MKQRKLLMALALLVSAWLAFFGDKTPEGGEAAVVAPTESARMPHPAERREPRPSAAAAASAASISPMILALRERAPYTVQRGEGPAASPVFGSQSWDPPPPKVVAPPPEPPQAPPLPYAYIGKKLEGGSWEVYLSRGDDTRVVKAKSVLDGTYRVESIAPPTLTLTYLPLKQVQQLSIGATD
jgi:hypothetical protein